MKLTKLITGTILSLSLWGYSEESQSLTNILSEEVTALQDELSADTQELVEIQTQEGVIKKLEEMENSMLEATLRLLENDTSGNTIAIQTEIIEKAYEAAKEKQKSQPKQNSTDKALLDALEKMLGKTGEGNTKPSQDKAESKGNSAAEGGIGKGASTSEKHYQSEQTFNGSPRSVPSVTPTSGELLPLEFQKLVEEYNQFDN